jgi:hypothetical protein
MTVGMRNQLRSDSGLSLLETLIATSVLITSLAGTAQLITFTARWLLDSGWEELALTAAQAQIEVLRSRAWTVDALGIPVTDLALAPSPPGALFEDVEGYTDVLDRHGRWVDSSSQDGVFRRRWAITRTPGAGPDAIAIEVCVTRLAAPRSAPSCLATIRTRQP